MRSASRIAERFAEAMLSERMPVRGEDDMARLAVSFNDMAESLQRQINNLEEFGNLQRRFTSDVSHELRTPLTTVRMAADLIYDHGEDLDPALRRSTELLVSELDRFEGLLNDLLEISRHDAGVAELSVEAVDLRSTVRNAHQGRPPRRRGRDRTSGGDADHEVIAEVDPRRVERILHTNLIANAIDHAEHKPVRIKMADDEDTVAVTVRDYGVGLRPGEEKSGVQPVLAFGSVPGPSLRGHRPGAGDQHRGRPAAPGPAGEHGASRARGPVSGSRFRSPAGTR